MWQRRRLQDAAWLQRLHLGMAIPSSIDGMNVESDPRIGSHGKAGEDGAIIVPLSHRSLSR